MDALTKFMRKVTFEVVVLFALCSLSARSNGILSTNGCPPCDPTTCPLTLCWEGGGPVMDPVCGCCHVCSAGEGERCGGMSNIPCGRGLECRHRVGNVMGEDRMGMCEKEQCRTTVCGYRQYCKFVNNVPECFCPTEYYNPPQWRYSNLTEVCYKKVNPVCGNDGKDYPSLCHLHHHECNETGKFVGVAYMGECDHGNDTALSMAQDFKFQQKDEQCWYLGRLYKLNTINPLPNDPCHYVICNAQNTVYIVPVPGCPGNPPDIDHGFEEIPIPGGWSPWSAWTPCVGGCGNGTQSRNRTCNNPAPRNEGWYCEGVTEETRSCYPDHCEFRCDYTPWSRWSHCSTTCGEGASTRRRSITNKQSLNVTKKKCILFQTKKCNEHRNCPINTGACKLRSLGKDRGNFYHLPVMKEGNLCFSVQKFEKLYCGGVCPDKNDTACHCRAVKYKYIAFQYVNCRPVAPRYTDVPVVTECACVEEGKEVPLPFTDDKY